MLVEDVRKIKGGAGLSVMMQEIDPRAGIGTKCSTMSQKAEKEQEQEQEQEMEVEVEWKWKWKWRKCMIIVDWGWAKGVGNMDQHLL